jgi:hypothetical protein
LALLSEEGWPGRGTTSMCRVARRVTGATGAGIMLMSDDLPRGSVCTTDPVSSRIADLQFDLGEGPAIDAHKRGEPVLEPDLADPQTPRWLAFTEPAVAAGALAVYGFPMRIGAVRLGALNLYRDGTGSLTDDEYADAVAVANIAAEAVLLLQAGAQPGLVAAELDSGSDFHYDVHRASGMVAAQLDVSVGQALVRLRAHAFANDLPVREIAKRVVARELSFPIGEGLGDDLLQL